MPLLYMTSPKVLVSQLTVWESAELWVLSFLHRFFSTSFHGVYFFSIIYLGFEPLTFAFTTGHNKYSTPLRRFKNRLELVYRRNLAYEALCWLNYYVPSMSATDWLKGFPQRLHHPVHRVAGGVEPVSGFGVVHFDLPAVSAHARIFAATFDFAP